MCSLGSGASSFPSIRKGARMCRAASFRRGLRKVGGRRRARKGRQVITQSVRCQVFANGIPRTDVEGELLLSDRGHTTVDDAGLSHSWGEKYQKRSQSEPPGHVPLLFRADQGIPAGLIRKPSTSFLQASKKTVSVGRTRIKTEDNCWDCVQETPLPSPPFHGSPAGVLPHNFGSG